MSSDSSSEDSGSGKADTMHTIYKGLAEVCEDDECWEYDPDYAFRLNDAKLDAAAMACFALRFVSRETDGDARLEKAVNKAGTGASRTSSSPNSKGLMGVANANTNRQYRFTKRSRRRSPESGHKLMMTRTTCWARRQQSDPASIELLECGDAKPVIVRCHQKRMSARVVYGYQHRTLYLVEVMSLV